MKDKPKSGWHKPENQLILKPKKTESELYEAENKRRVIDYQHKQIKRGK
jgi:hypothetical protein